MVTTKEKLDCVRRELKLRRSLYPRWIENEKISQDVADREIAIMAAIEADYQREADAEAAQGRLPL